jgi:hypothetical protein
MAARQPGRYLAPISLLAIVVAIFLLVNANQGGTGRASTSPAIPRTLAHSPGHLADTRARFYVVRPGDTLSDISVRTGISLATLESLNPGLDPNALQTGQRLRLRR